MTIGERIKHMRSEKGLTLEHLAKVALTSRQTIQRYESGVIQNIPSDKIELIAIALNTSPAYLMGWGSDSKYSEPIEYSPVGIVYFPVIGSIAAGYDNLATEEYTGEQTPIPISLLRGRDPSEYFVLAVKGDSMYPQFLNGDKVLVQRTTSVDSGSIAVIMYNGDEATLKKVVYVYGEDWMDLMPANPEYKAKRIEGRDLDLCRVLGKVVMLLRDVM